MVQAFDYTKFAEDYAAARQIAYAAASTTKDDGTCNLDKPVIRLKKGQRIVESKLPDGCFKRNWMGPSLFLPGGPGQGNARLKYAEMMADELRKRGWSATVFYQMD